jgi:hypothetical protein
MTERRETNLSRLADRIANTLNRGERHFMLAGAELDWVYDLIRDMEKVRAAASRAIGEERKR